MLATARCNFFRCFLAQNPARRRYRLGLFILTLVWPLTGFAILRTIDLADQAASLAWPFYRCVGRYLETGEAHGRVGIRLCNAGDPYLARSVTVDANGAPAWPPARVELTP